MKRQAITNRKNSSKEAVVKDTTAPTTTHQKVQFSDQRPQATAQKSLQDLASMGDQAQKTAQLQTVASKFTSEKNQPVQKKENNTGLPDHLKSGIENLSGHTMDDVKVHYNSNKPAQLNAHAYAQGSNIHLASGQEKHLPHEAWHVVQQKQGRVKPTMQMKGKVSINDDAGLEHEADVMGAKALQLKTTEYDHATEQILHINNSTSQPIQRAISVSKEGYTYETPQKAYDALKNTFSGISPRFLKRILEKMCNDDLKFHDFRNLKFHVESESTKIVPTIGQNVLIADTDEVLKDTFRAAMSSAKFRDLVKTVLYTQPSIGIALDDIGTRYLINQNTIRIKRKHNGNAMDYLSGLLFEMGNAYHTAEFNTHNAQLRNVVSSTNGGRARIRFGLTAGQFADAYEETEYKSSQLATEIGKEGVASHGWDEGHLKKYAEGKKHHMRIQKQAPMGGVGPSHWGRYFEQAKGIQEGIKNIRQNQYLHPASLRLRFYNDPRLITKYGLAKVTQAVAQAIHNNTLTDAAVMVLLKA